MIPLRDILESKEIPELRTILTQRGAGFHHKEKKETLINRILEVSMTAQPDIKHETQPTVQRRMPPAPLLTQDEVMARVGHYKERGLQIKFSDDGRLWHFRRKAGVVRLKSAGGLTSEQDVIKEDSGSMQQPLEIVERCAKMVMLGGAVSDVTV